MPVFPWLCAACFARAALSAYAGAPVNVLPQKRHVARKPSARLNVHKGTRAWATTTSWAASRASTSRSRTRTGTRRGTCRAGAQLLLITLFTTRPSAGMRPAPLRARVKLSSCVLLLPVPRELMVSAAEEAICASQVVCEDHRQWRDGGQPHHDPHVPFHHLLREARRQVLHRRDRQIRARLFAAQCANSCSSLAPTKTVTSLLRMQARRS